MLSRDEFRRIALTMGDAIESAHMVHPDFRANGRIFATLLYPDNQWGMVKLTPDQQEKYVREDPATFVPAKGEWGRQGCTSVRLDSADEASVREVMKLAWQSTAKKRVTRRSKAKAGRRRVG